jgi:hypothetical protein
MKLKRPCRQQLTSILLRISNAALKLKRAFHQQLASLLLRIWIGCVCGKRFDADQHVQRLPRSRAGPIGLSRTRGNVYGTRPIRTNDKMLSLGDGWTMMHHANRLGTEIGCPNTHVKDESGNATGSFKARRMNWGRRNRPFPMLATVTSSFTFIMMGIRL